METEYPQRLSGGLALVKWWLLAIPQYLIAGLFTGSGLGSSGSTASSSPAGRGWG